MEDILFDGYRKYLKATQDNVFRAFFKMPSGGKFFLIAIIVSMLASIAFLVFVECIWVSLISLAIDIALCIGSYFYVESYQIKTSDVRVADYKEYCAGINKWLESSEVELTKSNLTELRKRVLESWASKENSRKRGIERVEKWIQALLIPLLLAVFAEIIDGQTDVSILISSLLVLIIAIGVVCATAINFYNIVSFFQKRKLEQMRKFANDIQGVLDTQFEDGLIRKIAANIEI